MRIENHRLVSATPDLCAHACALWRDEYGIIDVVGHDEIAPGRKSDPGPAFPIDWLRDVVFPDRAEVFAAKGPDRGIANIEVDGVFQGTVDLYAAAPVAPTIVWSSADLVQGTHTIGVAVSGTKNAASSSNLIGYDAAQVTFVP